MPNQQADHVHLSRLIQTAQDLLNKGGTLESRGGVSPIDLERISAAVEQRVGEITVGEDTSPRAVAAEVLSNAKSALAKAAAGASASILTDPEWASLEAIIQVTGRPALRYKHGQVEMPNDVGENQHWGVLIATARNKINRASASVGRVSSKQPTGAEVLIGTAWRIGDTLVVTNRHVVACLVLRAGDPVPSWKLDSTRQPRVEFGPSGDSAPGFAVSEIAYCAPEKDVDLAIMRLECGVPPPPPLTIDWSPQSLGRDTSATDGGRPQFKGKEIYVVGHPYRQLSSDPIVRVFGTADGSKRFSPGFVTAIAGAYLEHDCSTLGGNSGSCVLTTGRHAVVGLHFAGLEVDGRSGRGRANLALALSQLGDGPATSILRSGKV